MLLSDVSEYRSLIIDVRQNLTRLTQELSTMFCDEDCISELMTMRKYSDPRMYALLKSKGIFKVPCLSDIQVIAKAHNIPFSADYVRNYGLVGSNGGYWLQSRFCIPIRDIAGQVIAWVCWFPDNRKYITTGTLGFTNTSTFFNAESYAQCMQSDHSRLAFVVEGIFDALSISSLGYCALGNQGLAMPPVKREMLNRFDTVVFIPDNDSAGRQSNPYLSPNSSHKWTAGTATRIVELQGKCKDMDDMIKTYQPENLDFLLGKDSFTRVLT